MFDLKITDYKGWCRGLRKAGYATNPKYHTILINLIERYDLYEYDLAPSPGKELPTPLFVQEVNEIPVVVAGEGETVAKIAYKNELREKQLRKWNDLESTDRINKGDVVYLKPKRRRGNEKFHIVEDGEDMHSISQKHGIKIKHLYKKNRMLIGTEPAIGEKIFMQKKRPKTDLVATKNKEIAWEEKKEEKKFVNPHSVAKTAKKQLPPGPINKDTMTIPDFHIVKPKENIYRIAERYHVLEEDLLTWNNINAFELRVGQKIYLSKEAIKKHLNRKPVEKKRVETAVTEKEMKDIEKEIVVDGPVSHVVVKGETLYGICKRYKITENQLKKWNNLDTITIYVGQKLQVSE